MRGHVSDMNFFLIAIIGTMCGACSLNPQQQPSRPIAQNQTSRVTFQAPDGDISFEEGVAQAFLSRQNGLMFRKNLEKNAGMLFIFDSETEQTFWMKNTLIALDLIFLDNQKRVVGIIENATPQSLAPLSVDRPSRYVLEINGGLAQKRGIKKNMQAVFFINDP